MRQVPAHPITLMMTKMQVTATMMITNNWSHTDSLARVRFFRRSSSSAGTSSLLNLTRDVFNTPLSRLENSSYLSLILAKILAVKAGPLISQSRSSPSTIRVRLMERHRNSNIMYLQKLTQFCILMCEREFK